MHVKAKFRQVLLDVHHETQVPKADWYLIRDDNQVGLVTEQPNLISTDKVAIKNEFGEIEEIEPEIGDSVKTDEISGQLLCSSKAGVNALDLFNHVLTEEPILRNFLGAENCDESDKQPSVVIKSYLKFCAVTESDVWQPKIVEHWDQTFDSEFCDETEDEISENEKLDWEEDIESPPEVVDNDRKWSKIFKMV